MKLKIRHLEGEYYSDTVCNLFQYFFKQKKSDLNQHFKKYSKKANFKQRIKRKRPTSYFTELQYSHMFFLQASQQVYIFQEAPENIFWLKNKGSW